ncbi:DNA-directed RNA polymerase subunit K/omega [Flexivirga oryzae]|uniref:DNA-directed RNA polymerase subunit K/omega n=1 Tax=Flexivirga oryzae TaxID=1794944 RepID=A0A839N5W6_9MICO|nr:DNA-directed RNA polymerase subunit K/omega [Flexivirga oryzae]
MTIPAERKPFVVHASEIRMARALVKDLERTHEPVDPAVRRLAELHIPGEVDKQEPRRAS